MPDQQDLFGAAPSTGLSTRSAAQVVPFGKYKSQPYEVLLSDAGYAMYLLSSMYGKLQSHYPALLAFLVKRYGLPDSTPEHNRLQNRFLDDSFAVRFAISARPSVFQALASLQTIDLAKAWARYVTRELLAEKERSAKRQSWEPKGRLPELRDELIDQAASISFIPSCGIMEGTTWLKPVAISELEFEKGGADVSFSVVSTCSVVTTAPVKFGSSGATEQRPIGGYNYGDPYFVFRVEVKPIVGDDYPAILRAMKAAGARQLLVGEYTGVGASWDEMVKVFALSGITVVLLDDVENTPQAPEKVEIKPISATEAESIVASTYTELTSE